MPLQLAGAITSRHRPTHRVEPRWRPIAAAAKAAAGALGWTLSIAALAVLVGLGVGPRTGSYRTLTVLSGSMSPGIPVGALVIDTVERPDQIRPGQVLSFQVPVGNHQVETHRVIQVLTIGDRVAIRTKGDANRSPDPWTAVVSGSTVWRMRAVVPDGGWILLALRRRVVRGILIWGVPGLLGILWLVDIWRQPSEPLPVPRHSVASSRRRRPALARGAS